MALTDQPYFPFYVDDYISDEKLAECSIESEGIYIRLLCYLHKSEFYGKIKIKALDKAKLKQKASKKQANAEQKEVLEIIGMNELDFAMVALKVQNIIKRDFNAVYDALLDLLAYEVLTYEGGFLYQKRMVKDGEKSKKRAIAGAKGGKGNKKEESKEEAKQKQMPGNVIVIEIENEIENKTIKNGEGKNELLEDQIFVESARKLYGVDQDVFEKMLNDFVTAKQAMKKAEWKSYGDFRNNFFNWIPKRLKGYKPEASEYGQYSEYEYNKLLEHPHTIKKDVDGITRLALDENGKVRYNKTEKRKKDQETNNPEILGMINKLASKQ